MNTKNKKTNNNYLIKPYKKNCEAYSCLAPS